MVQIFTRRDQGEGVHPYLRIAGGSQGTWERSLGVSGGDQQTRYSLNTSLEETAGIDRTGPSWASDADHDAYRNHAFSFNLSHRFNDDLQIGLSALDQRGKSEYDNPYGRWDDSTFTSFPAKPCSDYSLSSLSAFVDARLSESWNSRLEIGHGEDKLEDRDKLFAGTDTFNSYRNSAAWLNNLDLGNGHGLLLGADYQKDNLHSSTAYSEESRWNQAGFIQHNYRGEHFSTELGLRHDKNQQFGSENTWNAALTVPLNRVERRGSVRTPKASVLHVQRSLRPCFLGCQPGSQSGEIEELRVAMAQPTGRDRPASKPRSTAPTYAT